MKEAAVNTLENINEKHFFESILAHAVQHKKGVALWQNPQTNTKQILFGNTTIFNIEDIENNHSGFVFHPYSKEENGYFIEADFKASYNNKPTIEKDNSNENGGINYQRIPEAIDLYYNSDVAIYCTENESFRKYVSKGVEAIKEGSFQKIVASRSKNIQLPEKFNAVETFQKLCSTYPNAFISIVSIPEAGTWMGATPELLIEVKDDRYFKTVALAGTQKYDGKSSLSSIAWTQKEIEEQALVSRYIINCFKKIRLREFEENGPKTVIAGNLLHLKTIFSVDMKTTNFPQLGSVMLNLLHPTSAICGMPQEKANDFISKNEGNNRAFFSGYLGPINLSNQTSIFVNLRCMQISNKNAVFYAGAGLTEDSDPDKELEETELKINTLLHVINS